MITSELVQELRALTDAPLAECNRALRASLGDNHKAEELIRTRRVPSQTDLRIFMLEERVRNLEEKLLG